MRRFCAVVASAALLSGCSDGSSGGHGGTALERALASVVDNPTTRAYVAFSTPDAASKHSNGTFDNPYGRFGLIGAGELATYARISGDKLGVDPNSAQTAITAGTPPWDSIDLTGVATDAVGAKLTALGATKDPDGTYRFGPDHHIPAAALKDPSLGFLLHADVIRIDGDRLLVGSAADDLKNFSGDGKSLADDGDFRAVASCLGDPFAAMLADKVPAAQNLTPPQRAKLPPPTAGVKALGVGSDGTQERICVSLDSAAHAQQAADTIKQDLANGSSAVTQTRWSEAIPGATVSRDGSVVRIGYPVQPSHYSAIEGLSKADLPGLSGS